MAQADDESNTPRPRVARAPTVRREVYVQPGLRLSSEACREIGIPELRGQIVSGKRKAFELYPDTGTMKPIKPERFRAESAVETLQRGFYFEESSRFVSRDDGERDTVYDYHPVFLVVEDVPTASVAVLTPLHRPHSVPPISAQVTPSEDPAPSPKPRGAPGAKPKFDWDVIQAFCFRRFGEDGYPDNVSEFCRDVVIPWCNDRYDEDKIPDEGTLRQYVAKWIDAWVRSSDPKIVGGN